MSSELKETEEDALDNTAIYAWGGVLVFGTIASIFLMMGVYDRGQAKHFEEGVINASYPEVISLEETQNAALITPVGWEDKTKKLVRLPIEDAKAATLKALQKN